jgi:acetyl esterase/lipase
VKSLDRIRGFVWALLRPFFDFIPFLAVLLFFGALFWAKAQDPFSRKWFTLNVSSSGPLSTTLSTQQYQSPSPQPSPPGEGGESIRRVKCVVVLPKPIRSCPVVVYAHGSGGSLMNDGNALRQMAELGLATVGLEYDQTNEGAFPGQFEAVLDYLGHQKWANTNAIAWVGFSLGANRMLDFAVQHPDRQPQLMVQLSGAGTLTPFLLAKLDDGRAKGRLSPALSPSEAEREKNRAGDSEQSLTNLHCPVLLVHGEQDLTFPLADTKTQASVLQSNGLPVELKIVPGAPHGMEPDTGLVFRSIGEYCLTHLTGKDALQSYHSIAQFEAEAPAFWLFCLPAAAWLVFGIVRRRKMHPRAKLKLTPGEKALRWVAGILAVWALVVTAIHLVPPHLLVNDQTLSIARKHLIEPKQSNDFEFLAAQPIWHGQKLKTLLDHVELAGYNRELINWQLDGKIYRDFVLSPVVEPSTVNRQSSNAMNWRRPLWEEFYPRIRHESSPDDAARIVVRHLRERVTIADIPDPPHDIPTIWLRQITDEAGFEVIYAAALRSVGVPARLDANGRAEYWNGAKWTAAPSPAVAKW